MCIAQQDYCCILNQVEKNMQKVEEEGEIVMVKEHRELDRTGTRKGHIVIKVTFKNQLIYASLNPIISKKRSPLEDGLISHLIYDLGKHSEPYVLDASFKAF